MICDACDQEYQRSPLPNIQLAWNMVRVVCWEKYYDDGQTANQALVRIQVEMLDLCEDFVGRDRLSSRGLPPSGLSQHYKMVERRNLCELYWNTLRIFSKGSISDITHTHIHTHNNNKIKTKRRIWKSKDSGRVQDPTLQSNSISVFDLICWLLSVHVPCFINSWWELIQIWRGWGSMPKTKQKMNLQLWMSKPGQPSSRCEWR